MIRLSQAVMCVTVATCGCSQDKAHIHESIAQHMRDPSSLQFKEERLYSRLGETLICGKLNAKNGFGGYDGFRQFVATTKLFAVADGPEDPHFKSTTKEYCRDLDHEETPAERRALAAE